MFESSFFEQINLFLLNTSFINLFQLIFPFPRLLNLFPVWQSINYWFPVIFKTRQSNNHLAKNITRYNFWKGVLKNLSRYDFVHANCRITFIPKVYNRNFARSIFIFHTLSMTEKEKKNHLALTVAMASPSTFLFRETT